MKEAFKNYIEEFNEVANIYIEYAALEPFFSSTGKVLYNLHLVYSPHADFMVHEYLSGNNAAAVLSEKVCNTSEGLKSTLLSFGVNRESQSTGAAIPINLDLFDKVSTTVISNVGRFYNFKLQSPTDPFLSMYLEAPLVIRKSAMNPLK